MRMHIRRLFLRFIAGAICAHSLVFGLSSPGGSEESPNLTYRSVATEVRLVFFATDQRNHQVEDVQRNDFAVVDDDTVIRDFRSFTRSAAVKLDVIVLFDSSESVLPQFKQEMSDVVQLVSQWTWNAEDNVSVLSFSGVEAHPICTGDCRSAFTADRVAALPRGGSTPLFDALDTATNLLGRRRQPEVWPVIILFSDGDDTISVASFNDALQKVLASGAQVYAVDVRPTGQESSGTTILQRLADDSGGRYVRVGEGAARIFSDVIDDLHSALVVTYVPPTSSHDFHSVRVLPTHNLKLQFRCRRGYYHRIGDAH